MPKTYELGGGDIFHKIFLLIVALVQSDLLYADDDFYSQFSQMCIGSRQWDQVKCTIDNVSEEKYQQTFLGEFIALPAINVLYFLTESASTFSTFSPMSIIDGPGLGHDRRETVGLILQSLAKKQNLNECQKSCLIKCATSQLFKYEDNLETRYFSIGSAYENGKAQCIAYQKIAEDLGHKLNINVRDGVGPGHAFNWYQINGRWVIGDGQDESCEFLTRDALGETELEAFAKQLNEQEEVGGIEERDEHPLSVPADRSTFKLSTLKR